MYLPCTKCGAEIAPVEVLRRGSTAWPELQIFHSTCPLCTEKLVVRVEPNSLKIVKMVSPTSQYWDILRSVQVENLNCRIDTDQLYCLHDGTVYEFAARQQ